MLKTLRRIKIALNPGIHQADLLTLIRGLSRQHLIRARIESFSSLMNWIALPLNEDEIHSRNVRYKFLIQFLERNPDEATHFIQFIFDFTRRGNAIRLFSLVGVPENSGFFSEMKERLIRQYIVFSHPEHDLAHIFQQVFDDPMDAKWISENHEVILPPLIQLLRTHGVNGDELLEDLGDAKIILASQIASLGTSREIRRRLESTNLASSHFIQLGKQVLSQGGNYTLVLEEISHCREHLQRLRLSLELTGVSVDLIYQMERLTSLLDRLETLITLQNENAEVGRSQLYAYFVSNLITAEIKRNGVREFLKDHLHLVTRKVVERAGEKGDYYIAHTTEEKSHLFNAGAWAGVLTSFAALIKTLIGQRHFPYLIEGFLFFFNYSVVFLVMQKWHLALSSKLPAYTAAALSKQLESFKKNKHVYEVVSEIQKIFKSQMIAAVGNLVWVIAVCLIIDWILFLTFGRHLMTPYEGLQTIQKHDLLSSGTVFYSFITGIFLWLSSILGGAVENWLVFINFPQFIKESSLFNRLMDRRNLDTFAKYLPGVMGSMAGNLFIAALLAFPYVFGKITGLPIDIRHVTLSTGSITFAFNALDWNLAYWPLMLSMCMSILVMGVLNFGVSFYCALQLASLSQDLDRKHVKIILKNLFLKPKA